MRRNTLGMVVLVLAVMLSFFGVHAEGEGCCPLGPCLGLRARSLRIRDLVKRFVSRIAAVAPLVSRALIAHVQVAVASLAPPPALSPLRI